MDGASITESSPGQRMHSRRGGAKWLMISGSNEQRSRRHSNKDQDLREIKEGVERHN